MRTPKNWVLFFHLAENQEDGNKGPPAVLKSLPLLNSMLLNFCWHHWSWEDDRIDIWSTLDTNFISIIVNNIASFWDSSTSSEGFTDLLNQHFCFPRISFNHSSFCSRKKEGIINSQALVCLRHQECCLIERLDSLEVSKGESVWGHLDPFFSTLLLFKHQLVRKLGNNFLVDFSMISTMRICQFIGIYICTFCSLLVRSANSSKSLGFSTGAKLHNELLNIHQGFFLSVVTNFQKAWMHFSMAFDTSFACTLSPLIPSIFSSENTVRNQIKDSF